MSKISNYFKLVKFAHTIFALPFAMIGFTMGVLCLYEQNAFDFGNLAFTFVMVLVCMVSARNAAMGFNRYADKDIDALNPRTACREIPAGKISSKNAVWFVVVNILVFIIAARIISFVCFVLSPIVLLVLLGYSKVKRFSAACHFVLGLALSMAPAGAFVAVVGKFFTPDNFSMIMSGWGYAVLVLSLIVLLWSSGFDILYSLSDEEFDKAHNLHSIPALVGRVNAMRISLLLHLCIVPLLLLVYYLLYPCANVSGVSNYIFIAAIILFTILLVFQHCIISPTNLKRLNAAFFTTNGLASLIFAVFTIIALVLR